MSFSGTKDSFISVWSVDGDYSFPQAGSIGTIKLAALSWGSMAQAEGEKTLKGRESKPGISVTAVF